MNTTTTTIAAAIKNSATVLELRESIAKLRSEKSPKFTLSAILNKPWDMMPDEEREASEVWDGLLHPELKWRGETHSGTMSYIKRIDIIKEVCFHEGEGDATILPYATATAMLQILPANAKDIVTMVKEDTGVDDGIMERTVSLIKEHGAYGYPPMNLEALRETAKYAGGHRFMEMFFALVTNSLNDEIKERAEAIKPEAKKLADILAVMLGKPVVWEEPTLEEVKAFYQLN